MNWALRLASTQVLCKELLVLSVSLEIACEIRQLVTTLNKEDIFKFLLVGSKLVAEENISKSEWAYSVWGLNCLDKQVGNVPYTSYLGALRLCSVWVKCFTAQKKAF